MPAWRRVFQTITGKPFCPIAAIAAPENVSAGSSRTREPRPTVWQSQREVRAGSRESPRLDSGRTQKGVPPEEPSGRVRGSAPNSLRRRFGLRQLFAHVAAKAKAPAMMAAASAGFKTSVRLQRSLAIVGALMFLPNCRRGIVSFSQHTFAIEDDVTVCQVRVRRMCNFDIKRGMARGRVMVRLAGLLSVSIANGQSVPDAVPLSYSAAE